MSTLLRMPSNSAFKPLAFLIGVMLGMLLYLNEIQSSAGKFQRIYKKVHLEQAELLKYNLLEDEFGEFEVQQILLDNTYECSLDYINKNSLQQDHPCVIRIIKEVFLNPPPLPGTELTLDTPSNVDHSLGKAAAVIRSLKNMTGGYFLDYCAGDGELMSGTLDLEIQNGWSGLLVEPNPLLFGKLQQKKRKSWTVPICLSSHPYPTKQNYSFIGSHDSNTHSVQCFPVYSVLLAASQTEIDFLNLNNIQGRELKVLKTIPWHKVKIRSIFVSAFDDWFSLIHFMEANAGFNKFDYSVGWNNSIIFVKA